MPIHALLMAAGLILALSACEYRQSGTVVPGYGNAVRQNNAVMIVDPEPAGAANTTIDMDGRRALLAIERYRNATPIEPEAPDTTELVPILLDDTGGGGADAGQ
jgi:hypothetical protein